MTDSDRQNPAASRENPEASVRERDARPAGLRRTDDDARLVREAPARAFARRIDCSSGPGTSARRPDAPRHR